MPDEFTLGEAREVLAALRALSPHGLRAPLSRRDLVVVLKAGVEVKSIEQGLLDYATTIAGQAAYWCWQAGEPEIKWWHSRYTGFAGRRRIEASLARDAVRIPRADLALPRKHGLALHHAADRGGRGDRATHRSPRRGFGSIRVAVRIGDSRWSTSIFPDRKTASFVLPIQKQVRVAEQIAAGSTVDVPLDVLEP